MANLVESAIVESLKCCFRSVKKVCSSIKSYKGNLKLLKVNIQSLSAKMDDIVRKVEDGKSNLKEVTNEARVWLQNVEVLLDDEEIKDLLNEDLRRAKDQCCFGIFLCNLYHRYRMSRFAKSKVDEIQQNLAQLPQDPVTVPKRTMDLDPIPIQHCKGLASRETLEQRILELLKDDQVDAVGICGMGGIGKTTLAKNIKNEGAKDMFDSILMVEISQVADIERIQDHIAASIGLSLDSKHSSEQRATTLYNALGQKKPKANNNDQPTKILIILDNIWSDLNLDEVGIPHKRTPQFCCKILFTSRERNVCRLMGVPDKNIVDVSMLSEPESSSLFREKIKNVDGNNVEKSLEGRLLRSCGGLPLAIEVLAKSLSGREISYWYHFADELEKPIPCRSDDVHHDAAYKIIEASYRFIGNNDKKMFFLLACLYPSGSRIPIEKLMRYGIGLSLFKRADSLMDVIKQANRWTDELVSSSLLLEDNDKDVDEDDDEDVDEYGWREVKVHDVVRSYTILCAEKGAEKGDGQKMMVEAIPRFDESWEKYKAISLANPKGYSRLRRMQFNSLEILILTGGGYFQLDDIFQGMPRLKVLQLSGLWSSLPKSITTLTHLRTLHLEYCVLGDGDMEMVSELAGLLVLSLRGSDVKMLPCGIKKLSHLRLLDLHQCDSLAIIPANVLCSLHELEGLYMLDCYGSKWQDNNSEMEQGTTTSIAELSSLGCLKVLEIQVNRIEQVTLSDMEFITSLQKFKFYAYRNVKEVDEFLKVDECLKFSSVNFEVVFSYSWEWFWKYPCLKALLANSNDMYISRISDDEGLVENLVPNLDREGFKDLENLQLDNLNGLNRICDGHVPPQMFRNLRHLTLKRLENLESYVLPVDGAPNLTTLSVSKCEKLKYIWIENVTQKEKHYELRFLKNLKLKRLDNLIQALGNDNVNISTCIGNDKLPPLFNTKTVFPSLEVLELRKSMMCEVLCEWDSHPMQEIVARTCLHFSPFPNLRKLVISGPNNMKTGIGSPSIAATLVHLETLQIQSCKKMKQVISEETEEEKTAISSDIIISFPKLHHLELACLDELECMYGGSYKVEFPSLKKMELDGNHSMTRFIGHESSMNFISKKTLFPSLEELYMGYCKCEVLCEWDSHPMQEIVARISPHFSPFPNLRILFIWGVNNMKTGIGSPFITSTLVHLEKLQIGDCKKMKQVISEETEEETQISSTIIIKFPKLLHLELGQLEKMECMYRGSYKIEFPTLKIMTLDQLPSMTRFVDQQNAVGLLREKVEFPSVEELYISGETPATPSINFYCLFQNLRTLSLYQLKWKHAFSKDMVPTIGLTQLNHLEKLDISNCENMETVVEEIVDEAMPSASSSSSSYLKFPGLTNIQLMNCSKLRWFFSTKSTQTILHLPSLQKVGIKACENMELFSNTPITMAKLDEVNVERSLWYRGDKNKVFTMEDGGDLNNILHNRYKYIHSEGVQPAKDSFDSESAKI